MAQFTTPPNTNAVLTWAGPPPAIERPLGLEPSYDSATPDPSVAELPLPPPPAPSASVPLEMQSTVDLLSRAKAGDHRAVDVLFERCVPPLRKWARGRLPAGARGLLETQDVVQDAVFNVLRRLDKFESRHQGALLAYLRQVVLNRIRDEARTLARRPIAVELDDHHPAHGASPLELAIDEADLARYEAALTKLRPADREAIVLRLEMQASYEEVARALGKPNANAARTFVVRALYKLYREMSHGG
jgi:RNA polymerase sigma-70 factor (ECF subfamily)